MIKNLENLETITMTIALNSGEVYSNKDVPEQPFGNEGCVSFFEGENIRTIPMALVKYIDMHTEKL